MITRSITSSITSSITNGVTVNTGGLPYPTQGRLQHVLYGTGYADDEVSGKPVLQSKIYATAADDPLPITVNVPCVKGNGTNNAIDCGSTPMVPATDDFTLEVEYYVTTLARTYQIVSQYILGQNGRFYLGQSGTNTWNVFVGPSINAFSGVAVTLGWHNLKLTRVGTTFELFVDGVSAGTWTEADSIEQTGNLLLARTSSGSDYNGALAEISDGRIAYLKCTNDTTATVTREYKFQEGAGTTVHNVQANANHATITGTQTNVWSTTCDTVKCHCVEYGGRLQSSAFIPALTDGSGLAANGETSPILVNTLSPNATLVRDPFTEAALSHLPEADATFESTGLYGEVSKALTYEAALTGGDLTLAQTYTADYARRNATAVPIVSGDTSVLSTLWTAADSACQLVGIIGDSQETNPGGHGTVFVPWMNAYSWYGKGVPSKTHLLRPNSERDFYTSCSVVDFTGTHPNYADDTVFEIHAQNGTTYGFLAAMHPLSDLADFTGGVTQLQELANAETWFSWTTLKAEIYMVGNAAGPDETRVIYKPQNSATNSYFVTTRNTWETNDELTALSLTSIGDTTWATITTPQLTDVEGFNRPAVFIQGWNGSAVTVGACCGGMRYFDDDRDEGIVFDAYSTGGQDADGWDTDVSGCHKQLNAYGPYSYWMICFGTNDANAVDDDQFKLDMQTVINDLRNGNFTDSDAAIILVADPTQKIQSAFTQTDYDNFLKFAEVAVELAAENLNVVAINHTRQMINAGYDPDTIDTSELTAIDGVHPNGLSQKKRAELIWNTLEQYGSV